MSNYGQNSGGRGVSQEHEAVGRWRFVFFCWALEALKGNELDYEIRSAGDRYEPRCYAQTLVIERDHRADLEAIVAALRVMVNQLRLPDSGGH